MNSSPLMGKFEGRCSLIAGTIFSYCQCFEISVNTALTGCSQATFNDGVCDEQNNNEECGFDGGDCCDHKPGWDYRCKNHGKVSIRT